MILPMTPRQLRTVALGLALSAAGGLGLVALASAHPADGPPGGPPHGMREPMGMAMPFAGLMSPPLLDEIDATAQQREQLRTIAEAARSDWKAQHEAGKAEHDQLMQLFTQPTVDAKAAEALRKQMLARQDTASKRMTQAMLESAQVLTVDQRLKMAELIKQHTGHMPPPPHARAETGEPAAR
ncbi:MAG TPA: Spy/CpxP family protein refolding chaperone [Ideonella sp.]|nr:Spy/CpxP family protein refolding chaperone [Ideonella sp.]